MHSQLEDRVNTAPNIITLHPHIELLMGVQLSDNIGQWVMDGVLVLGIIPTVHTPTEGQV